MSKFVQCVLCSQKKKGENRPRPKRIRRDDFNFTDVL